MCTFQVGSQKEAKANRIFLVYLSSNNTNLVKEGRQCGMGWGAAFEGNCLKMCMVSELGLSRWGTGGGAMRRVGTKPEGAQYAASSEQRGGTASENAVVAATGSVVVCYHGNPAERTKSNIDIAINTGGGIRTASHGGWQDLSRSGAVGGDKCGGSTKEDYKPSGGLEEPTIRIVKLVGSAGMSVLVQRRCWTIEDDFKPEKQAKSRGDHGEEDL
ncbi:hypothetical protein K438DRAFT_1777068 [Mycena galopus ATCC 62051]|nr:hypothetical protein K438DRAFT_1777068 [Mycena galopus ATCC 62051]